MLQKCRREILSRLIQPCGLKYSPAAAANGCYMSRLIQPCGLKWLPHVPLAPALCRGLYSLVDWNKRLALTGLMIWVEARTALWVENRTRLTMMRNRICRGLYSLVDWNWKSTNRIHVGRVEAYTALWIEMMLLLEKRHLCLSRLIQPCGLKYGGGLVHDWRARRGLYSLVDWNKALASVGSRIEVEAYTALWIEIQTAQMFYLHRPVEAYTALWIEMP